MVKQAPKIFISKKDGNEPQANYKQNFGKRHLNSTKITTVTDFQSNKNVIDMNYEYNKILPIYDEALYKAIITKQEVLLDENQDAWDPNEKLNLICEIKGDIANCYYVKPEHIFYCDKSGDFLANRYLYEGFLIKGQMEGYSQ